MATNYQKILPLVNKLFRTQKTHYKHTQHSAMMSIFILHLQQEKVSSER